jgi:autonomous glycyl radical cofactor GrcA
MTNLERRLASILAAIAEAGAAGASPMLAALVRRRDAICAALAAPEHAPAVPVRASGEVRQPSLTRARQRALVDPCL